MSIDRDLVAQQFTVRGASLGAAVTITVAEMAAMNGGAGAKWIVLTSLTANVSELLTVNVGGSPVMDVLAGNWQGQLRLEADAQIVLQAATGGTIISAIFYWM